MSIRLELSLKIFAVLASCVVAAAAFYGIVTKYDLIRPIPVEKPFKPLLAQPLPTPEMGLPVEQENEELIEAPPPRDYLFIQTSAQVSPADGAVALIRLVGRGERCEGSFVPPRKKAQGWSQNLERTYALSTRWCVAAQPGSEAAYRDFNGAWATEDGAIDPDYAVNYLRYVTPEGTTAAIKVTALAVCDENKGCGYVASVQAGIDDGRVEELVPVDNGEYRRAWLNADDESTRVAEVEKNHLKEPLEYRLTVPERASVSR